MDPPSRPATSTFRSRKMTEIRTCRRGASGKGMPDPNELSGVLWEPLRPFGLRRVKADAEVAGLLENCSFPGSRCSGPRPWTRPARLSRQIGPRTG